MSNNYSVIYYSNFCNNSKDLLKELTEHALLKNFERICIDRNQNINLKLPSFLKEVPTIIVPDYDQPLVGIDAFKWIKWKLKQMNQKSGKLNPYEGDAFSNSYSSLSDNVISTDTSNFTSLDDNNKIITQSQEELKSYSNSISNNVEQNYEQLIQSRNDIG